MSRNASRQKKHKSAKSEFGWTRREPGESLRDWMRRERQLDYHNTESEQLLEAEIERQRRRVKKARGAAKAEAKAELEKLERQQDEIDWLNI